MEKLGFSFVLLTLFVEKKSIEGIGKLCTL